MTAHHWVAKQCLLGVFYVLWCIGAVADMPSDWGTAIQVCAMVVIGIIGWLVKTGISTMQRSIDDQGERLRHVENNLSAIRERLKMGPYRRRDNDDN
jgi:hypothetical protein